VPSRHTMGTTPVSYAGRLGVAVHVDAGHSVQAWRAARSATNSPRIAASMRGADVHDRVSFLWSDRPRAAHQHHPMRSSSDALVRLEPVKEGSCERGRKGRDVAPLGDGP
jgi:hypothetical protein